MRKIIFTLFFLGMLVSLNAQTGTLDPSFGTNGIVTTALTGNGNISTESVRKCFALPDGKLLLVLDLGTDVILSRRLPNGKVDSAYANNGFSIALDIFNQFAAIQSDGKIIVGGTTNFANSDFILARYNVDGSLDQGFGNAGIAITDVGSKSDEINAVQVQIDGKILAAGHSLVSGVSQFALLRYSVNGIPDEGFGVHGIVKTDFGSACEINSISVQTDGKIVAAGNVSGSGSGDFAVARYDISGALDPAFNGNGKLVSDFGYTDIATSCAVQPDGQILVAGYYHDYGVIGHYEIARYNADGSADLSFNGSGYVTTDFGNQSDYFASLLLQADGKIVAGGYTVTSTDNDFAIARFNSNESPDLGFGINGKQVITTPSSFDMLFSLDQQFDGKIIASGFSSEATYDFMLVRLDQAGLPDPSFGTDGIFVGYYPRIDYVNQGIFNQNGKLLVNSYSGDGVNFQQLVTRFNLNGTPDISFGQNGRAIVTGRLITVQSDGKIINVEQANSANGVDLKYSRYNSDGSIDQTFGVNGAIIRDIGENEDPSLVAIQPDGKIIIAGIVYNNAGSDMFVIRTNPDGSLDGTFGSGGKIMADFDTQDVPQSIDLALDGKIIIGGSCLTPDYKFNLFVGRFRIDGSPDTTFLHTGRLIVDQNPQNLMGSVVTQADKKILIGWLAGDSYNAYTDLVSRYNENGILDNGFGQGGKIVVQGWSLKIEDDQKILVMGDTINAQNSGDGIIQRFNADGTPDATFGHAGQTITSFTAEDDNIFSGVIFNNHIYVVGSAYGPDAIGLMASYNLLVQATVLSCPVSIVVDSDPSYCTARVLHIDPSLPPGNNDKIGYRLRGATRGSGRGSVSGKIFNKGITQVTYFLQSDTSKKCSFSVTVQDKQAPVINNLRASETNLIPANHQLREITVNYWASDNCGVANSTLSVSSDEPILSAEPGDQSPDWIIVDNHHIKLRAERLNSGNGRHYAIKLTVTDADGNQTVQSILVDVPKTPKPVTPVLTINASPNPSSSSFQVIVNSTDQQTPINLRLLNTKGNSLQCINSVTSGQMIRIGGTLHSGTYYLEARQGQSKSSIKLIKY